MGGSSNQGGGDSNRNVPGTPIVPSVPRRKKNKNVDLMTKNEKDEHNLAYGLSKYHPSLEILDKTLFLLTTYNQIIDYN